jgi:two-component system sensor histidine kinase SenX3
VPVVGLALAFGLGILAMAALTYRLLSSPLAELEAAVDIDSPHRGVKRLVPRLRRIGDRMTQQALVAERAVEQLRAVIELSQDEVFVCDADGEVIHGNRRGVSIGDARHEEVLLDAAADEVVRAALAGEGGERSLELFGPPARTVSVRSSPIGPPAAPVGVVAVVHDESRLRQLESVRRDFVANLSHELKTPIGGLALLGEALAEVDDASQVRAMAGQMTAESHRVARIVEDLLVLSEIEADAATGRTAVGAGALIERATGAVAVLAEQHGVTIEAEDDTARARMRGDPDRLASALTNLVENAVKYSGSGSSVWIRAHESDAAVQFEVVDEGIGIPRADLDRIFERFYRVDRARSRDTGGTGLGLAIVRNIADLHDGSVAVQSREGEGSTFVLRIPSERGDGGGR